MLAVMAALGLAVAGEGSQATEPKSGVEHTENSSRQTGLGRALGKPQGVTSLVSDDFERAALGPNWNVHVGNPGIVSGSDLGLLSGAIAILSWAAPLPADQFSQAEIAADIDPQMQRQVFVRRRASDGARYALHYNLRRGEEGWEIKYDGVPTPQTKLLATAATPSRPVAGDVIRVEAEGNSIRGYKNGRLVLQATDTSTQKLTAGTPGMAFPFVPGPVPRPSPVFETWTGGELAPREPRLVRFASGSPILYLTGKPACFLIRFVPNTRVRHVFTVTDVRKAVVWRSIGLGEAGRPKVIRWCGRTKSKTTTGTPLPAGRYRAKLQISVARAGNPPVPTAFFVRTWVLTIRSR